MLTTVNADADRLARLIAELLDVARIDTGRLQLYPRESSAEVLVRRVVDSIEAGTAREISLEVEDELPEVFADPDKFTQVVTNLVENAVRHGQGQVCVQPGSASPSASRRARSRSTTRATASPWSCAAGSSPSSGPPATSGGSGLGHVHRGRADPRPRRLGHHRRCPRRRRAG